MNTDNTPIKDPKTFIQCECFSEGLLCTNAKDEKQIYLAMFSYGIGYKPKRSIWERLSYAWHHIRTGDVWDDELIMDYSQAKELAIWLETNTI